MSYLLQIRCKFCGRTKVMEAHTDGSEFSFIIALNDEYEGGGTRFMRKIK